MTSTFVAAAMGNPEAQVEMLESILGTGPMETLPDAMLMLAYTWASAAYVNGAQHIRPTRAYLLVTIAHRSVAAADPPEVAIKAFSDAIAHA